MNPHDRLRIVVAEASQEWRAFAYVMQAHENHCIKRAGVAGIRARATGLNGGNLAQSPARWRRQSVRVRNHGQKESAPQNAAEALCVGMAYRCFGGGWCFLSESPLEHG
ncbi:hypothetical protein GJX34_01590 [Salmonella enterica]|nr:hypothetical protein [Salmonella enterica]EAQ0491740.1 hypothetical protein [Salmonella enterica]EBC0806931.1 hypothetical protein [Salmonella enterica]EDY7271950.1 hypothetical protein [Salmonella enterica]EEC2879939.1 hypothetical protein [Salmonella enterica]